MPVLLTHFDGDTPTGLESQFVTSDLIVTLLYSADFANAPSAHLVTSSLFSTQLAKALEAQYLTSSLITASLAVVDLAIAQETQLTIFLASDNPPASDSFLTCLSSTDNIPEHSTNFKYIFSYEHPSAPDAYFLSQVILLGTTESAIASETQLTIHLSSESATVLDSILRSVFDAQPSILLDIQYILSSLIDVSAAVTDSVLARETSITIILGYDSCIGLESLSGIVTPIPPPSTNSLTDVYYSILQVIINSGIVGPQSAKFVVDPDSITLWPTGPMPLCLLEPGKITDVGNAIGAGRYGKVWRVEIIVHIIVQNIYDTSFDDSILVQSNDPATGPYYLVDQLVNNVCQSFPLNALGQPTLIELPYFIGIDPPRRYKQANNCVGIPSRFYVTFREILPKQLP
jgi:hypothetical protein